MFVGMTEQGFEGVEPFAPETLVEPEPLGSARERPRVQPAEVRTPLHCAAYQTCTLQGLDVFRGSGERHLKRFSKFADGMFPRGKATQHSPARRIGQGAEHAVET